MKLHSLYSNTNLRLIFNQCMRFVKFTKRIIRRSRHFLLFLSIVFASILKAFVAFALAAVQHPCLAFIFRWLKKSCTLYIDTCTYTHIHVGCFIGFSSLCVSRMGGQAPYACLHHELMEHVHMIRLAGALDFASNTYSSLSCTRI